MFAVFLKSKKKILRRHWKESALLGLFIFGGGALLWIGSLRMPDFNSFEERKVASSTKIYDRTGKIVLYDVHQNIRRTVIPGSDMGVNIKNATIAIEDSDFYQHHGVKPTAVLRAVIMNFLAPFTGGNYQGGSTITQQVIKNALLTSDRSVTRKLKEWVLAVKLEQIMSKDDILTLYLNEAPYGGNMYGIAEAARSFFGKEPRELSLAEAAYLAALPQAPSHYSPYGNNRDGLDGRARLVLKRMRELNFISEDDYGKALAEKVEFLPGAVSGGRAMHFVMFVRDYLEEKYGRDALESGGLKVTTTLDFNMQSEAEDIVKKYALENKDKFNAENASLVAIDPKTGDILAMVGSRDYFDKEIDGNFNVAIAHRQPGSAFKPFVYATAFEKGYTPDTVLFDLPTEFQSTCTPEGKPKPGTNPDDCYMPENYDHVYRGPISLRNALAQSINIPAIKTLYLAGIKDSIKTASDMGIKSLTDPDRYGLTLVLGGGEVSLLDITSAYSVFANDGVRNPYRSILKVEDDRGNVLEGAEPNPSEVLPKNIALEISDVLSDNNARTPAFGDNSALYVNYGDVAAKTGTTNDYRDAWIIGYTPYLAVGAWAGNNDNSPMEKKVAGFIVAPLWHEFVASVVKNYPPERFEKPLPVDNSIKPALRGFWQGNETFVIDKISGKLATDLTPKETREERPLVNVHSILYWVDKNNPLGPVPGNPNDDPQFNLWETPVQEWLQSKKIAGYSKNDIPSTYDNVHRPEFYPKISITEPKGDAVYGYNSRINVKVQSVGMFPLSRVDFFLNGAFVGSSKTAPFGFSFTPKDIDSINDTNELKVVGYDTAYNSNWSSVTITVNRN